MKVIRLLFIPSALLPISLVFFSLTSLGQTNAVRARVTQAVDTQNLVTLRGNVHPLARPEFDQGVAPDDLPMERMLLVLQRGPEQEAALRQLLDDQQVKSSPRFHQWLTPEQFGQQFGPADSDLQAVTDWLASQGFQVTKVAAGRTVIEFSGTAGLVRQVLGTEIHKFTVNGEDRWANTSDPQVPAALAPVVASFASLNNFPRHQPRVVNAYSRSQATGEVHALFTLSSSGTNYYAVAPMDFATIYNVLPLWNAGVDGTGQTIAIISDSNIHLSDVEGFRNTFGLPAKDPQIILDGPNPGITGDETEADIDVEWSGAVARNATIDLVVSESTESTWGGDLSALYIIDNNLAPIMSVSYGECEQFLGAGGNAFYYATREQGAAEGITIINSSGDAGSARCDQSSTELAAQNGLAVSGFASTPFNVAVGGTDFGDVNNWSQYWNSTNSSPGYGSAKSYIPETPWNSSCAASGQASSCSSAGNDSPQGIDLVAGGGGPSTCGVWSTTGTSATCASGYPKPAWQSGIGVPNDGVRDIPDVSLFASSGKNGSFYALCEADAVPGYPSCNNPSGNWYFVGVGGTSVAAPNFAGIMALVNQKYGRQGVANYVLYPLAAHAGASCTSTAAAVGNSNCIFYDIVNGNNSVACLAGSKNCSNTSSSGFGILVNPTDNSTPAWTTTAGYDLATGLGSVNAANLVNQWTSVTFSPTTTALSSFPAAITHGQPVSFTVNVTSGSGTPTGDVSLIAQTGNYSPSTGNGGNGIGPFTLNNGSVSGSTDMLPGGTYNVVAHYAGDGIHGASNSAPQLVTVEKENSQTTVELISCDYASGACTPGVTSAVYGSSYEILRVDVTNANGGQPCASATTALIAYPCPTGTVTVTSNGQPVTTFFNPPGNNGALGYILNSQGYAEYQSVQLPGGTYPLVATYPGDTSYNASTSVPLPLNVTKAPTTITFSSPSSIVAGGLNFNASITTQSHGYQPEVGSFQIMNGSTSIAWGGDPPEANGSATTFASVQIIGTTVPLSAGTYQLKAQFTGDTYYAPSNTVTTAVSVTDFSLGANPASITIPAPGQSGDSTVTISPLNGFSGTVSLILSGACPTGATCMVSPSSVTLTGSSPATAAISITTTAASTAPPLAFQRRLPPKAYPLTGWPWLVAGLLALAALSCRASARRRSARWLFATALLVTAIVVACGGGSGGGGGSSPPPAPILSLSPTGLTFSSQNVGTASGAQSVLLENTGNAPLTISSMSVSGTNPGDFNQTSSCGSTVAAGGNCTISVTFKPTAAGSRSAALSISDNSSGSPQTISLIGTGVAIPPTPPGTYNLNVTATSSGLQHATSITVTVQ